MPANLSHGHVHGRSHAVPEVRAGYLIGRVERIVRRSVETAIGGHGLTLAQYTALSEMAARPGQSSAQLARRSLVSPQGMNNIVNDLETKGLIVRTPHEAGGRVLRVSVSRQGEEVLRTCGDAVLQIEEKLLSKLGVDERAALVASLQVLAGVSTAEVDDPSGSADLT